MCVPGLVHKDRIIIIVSGKLKKVATLVIIIIIIIILYYYYLVTIYYYYNFQITPTNHLLTALAIADLLTMVSYVPYAVYFYCITVPDPSYGHPAGWVVYLLFNVYFTITTHTAATWLTVTLAVFRYVVVCCHQALGARIGTLQRAKVRLINYRRRI